jgi:hypothetical protein
LDTTGIDELEVNVVADETIDGFEVVDFGSDLF